MTDHCRRAILATLLPALIALSGPACFFNEPACGPSMYYDEATFRCSCVENAILKGGGCTPCAADETVVAGSCACAEGQVKSSTGVCATVAGLGDPCSASAPCTDATYSSCAPSTAGASAGTCTKACTTNTDCDGAYTCATWEPQPYCREFSGVGKSCTSPADCAGNDAAYCESFQTSSCIVSGCSLTAQDCPRNTQCCDFSSFGIGNLCTPACL
jgi:hypothetical protein